MQSRYVLQAPPLPPLWFRTQAGGFFTRRSRATTAAWPFRAAPLSGVAFAVAFLVSPPSPLQQRLNRSNMAVK